VVRVNRNQVPRDRMRMVAAKDKAAGYRSIGPLTPINNHPGLPLVGEFSRYPKTPVVMLKVHLADRIMEHGVHDLHGGNLAFRPSSFGPREEPQDRAQRPLTAGVRKDNEGLSLIM
jgi:hypothetical protein